jgi:hypothetical protein
MGEIEAKAISPKYFGILVLIFIISIIGLRQYQKNKFNEYNELKYDDEILGIIDDVKRIKITSFITIDGKKIIIRSSENLNYEKVYIDKYLHIGDSIVKRANNDTIRILHCDQWFEFIHEGSIR